VLAGGDDYELCFTAAVSCHDNVQHISEQLRLPLTCIGRIVAEHGCIVRDAAGKTMVFEDGGYDHFR
jgi:thiamine-monophosphate kinase